MKINDILKETSSSGATSAGSVASVSSPMMITQRRNPNGTAVNALDIDSNIFGNNKKKKTKKNE